MDIIVRLYEVFSWWSLVAIMVPLFFALLAAWFAGRVAIIQLRLNTLLALMEQITSTESSNDRGLVKELEPHLSVEQVKEYVEWGRDSANSFLGSRKGQAIERTIARLDRVGYFVVANVHHVFNRIMLLSPPELSVNPPDWLWTITADIWVRVHQWVEWRANCKDKKWRHPGYGYYLTKLAGTRQCINRINELYPKQGTMLNSTAEGSNNG